MHIYLSFIDPKIKIFRDFRVFVLSSIPKKENSEITEILQKSITIKCENVVEMLFKWHKTKNQVPSCCLFRIFDPMGFTHVSPFMII